MRLLRSGSRSSAFGVTATGVLVGVLFAASPAHAVAVPASASGPSQTPAGVSAASTLVDRLGDRSAGAYVDQDSGALVVTVTDAAAAGLVRAAGAVPRVVANSRAALDRAVAVLDRSARIPGTSWAIDPVTNQVVVGYDTTVTGTVRDRLTTVVAGLGGLARLEATPGTLSTTIVGGDAVYGGSYRCSLGFNVRSGGDYYFLTAGHCGNLISTWYSDAAHTAVIGPTVSSSFPGNDYALVKYASGSSAVAIVSVGDQQISSAADPVVGQTVYRRGSTTGTRSGTVTALDATVNYSDGTVVSGLIRTTVCAQGGDSGGPLYAGSVAYGLTSGGNGNCTTGGTTFYQPVREALLAYGVNVYSGAPVM